jgi:hypothetical protein
MSELQMKHMPMEEKPGNDVNRLIFMMAIINPQNPRQFAGVCFGVVFKMDIIDDNTISMSWICIRQIQDKQSGEVMLQTPPPAMKWVMSKEQYYGLKPFEKDDYMGPGHLYRIIWMSLPEDDVTLPTGEVSRIIKPGGPPIILPGGRA